MTGVWIFKVRRQIEVGEGKVAQYIEYIEVPYTIGDVEVEEHENCLDPDCECIKNEALRTKR